SYLVQRGIPPSTIASAMMTRPDREKFFVVPGRLDAVAFRSAAGRATTRRFDPTRWFLREEELLHFGEQTFALSNQWSSATFPATIDELARAFPSADFEVEAE